MEKESALNLADIELDDFSSQIIQDNKILFALNDSFYRVRMPLQIEQAEVDHQRNLKQLEYMNEPGCISKKNLIKKLKESGVLDIEESEKRNKELIKELQQAWYRLATKYSDDTNVIVNLKNEIANIKEEMKQNSIELTSALSPCIESRLEKFYIEYSTYLLTEIKEEDKWVKVWKSFDEFLNADSTLTTQAISKLTWLFINKR